jgi:hypothetical protein
MVEIRTAAEEIERAHKDGSITDTQWQRYWIQALNIKLYNTASIHLGDAVTISTTGGGSNDRCRTSPIRYTIKAIRLEVCGISCPTPQLVCTGDMDSTGAGSGGEYAVLYLPEHVTSHMQQGHNDVMLEVELVVVECLDYGTVREIVRARIPLHGAIDLIPASGQSVGGVK